MQTIYLKIANKNIEKIRKISCPGQTESSGPIFGYFDVDQKHKQIIVITHLINKTSSSSMVDTEFLFTKTPRIIKKWNNKQERETKYIGSWHTHPTSKIDSSQKDWDTFFKINKQLKIAYTIFLIINSKNLSKTIIINSNKERKVIYEVKKF